MYYREEKKKCTNQKVMLHGAATIGEEEIETDRAWRGGNRDDGG